MATAERVRHKPSIHEASYGRHQESSALNMRMETSGGSMQHNSPVMMQRSAASEMHQAATSAAMQQSISAALHHGASSAHRDSIAASHGQTLSNNPATTQHNSMHQQDAVRMPQTTSHMKSQNSSAIASVAKTGNVAHPHMQHSGYVEHLSHPFPLLSSITNKTPRSAESGIVFPGLPAETNNTNLLSSSGKSENQERGVATTSALVHSLSQPLQHAALPSLSSKADGLTRAEIEAYVNALASRIDGNSPPAEKESKPKVFLPLKPLPREPGECEPPPDPSGSHKCDVCDRNYSTYQHLKRHAKIHDEFRPYRCDQCTKSFCDMNKLKRHSLTHTGEKPYACHVCDKKVSRPEHLKRHLLTHSEMRPFKCSVCDFSARRNDSVRSHVRSKHPDAPVIVLSVDEDVLEMQAQQQMIAHHTPSEPSQKTPTKKKSAKRLKPNPPDESYLANQSPSEQDRLQRHLESLATTQNQPMNMISNIALQQMRHYAERVEAPANAGAAKQDVSQLHQSNHDLVMSIKRGLQEKQMSSQLIDASKDKPKIKVEASDGQNQSKDVNAVGNGAVAAQVDAANLVIASTGAGGVPAFGQTFWNTNTTAIPATLVQSAAIGENSQNLMPQIPVPFSPHVFASANTLTDPKLQVQVAGIPTNISGQVGLSPYFMNAIHGSAAPRMLFNGVTAPAAMIAHSETINSTQSLTTSTDTHSTKAS